MRAHSHRVWRLLQASSCGDLAHTGGVLYCSEIWQGNVCMRRLLLVPFRCELFRLPYRYDFSRQIEPLAARRRVAMGPLLCCGRI